VCIELIHLYTFLELYIFSKSIEPEKGKLGGGGTDFREILKRKDIGTDLSFLLKLNNLAT